MRECSTAIQISSRQRSTSTEGEDKSSQNLRRSDPKVERAASKNRADVVTTTSQKYET